MAGIFSLERENGVMERDLILALDIGTSSLKASVVDKNGEILCSEKAEYETRHPSAGISEQDPMDWWKGTCKAVSAMIASKNDIANRIAVIGVSGHMLGCIPVDKEGIPLYPALIHSDSRAVKQFRQIQNSVGEDTIYQMSGNVLDARASLCKMLWFQQEKEDIYKKTYKFLQAKDFLVSRLTDNYDCTDFSDASHGELIDIQKKCYDSSLYQELSLDISKLPELHAGIEIVGFLTKQSALSLGLTDGIPVIAGGGDGACADIGAGNVKEGDIYCSLGTTAWISKCVKKPYFDPHKRTFNIMSLDGEHSSMFGTMQSAGGALTWAMGILGVSDLDKWNSLAAEINPGSDGLIFLPYLDGERSPIFDASARGCFFGLSLAHTKSHFMRAVFEGVAYALNSIFEVFKEQGNVEKMKIIGGGANSELWKQILTDVWEIPLAVLNTSAGDSCSLGAAAVAGTAVGLFSSLQEATKYIRIKKIIQPSRNKGEYKKYFSVYQELYPNTVCQMHKLQ